MGWVRNVLTNLRRLGDPPPAQPGAGSLNGINRRAHAGYPYDAGATGRRAYAWQATRIGQNTLLWSNLDNMVARSRDAIRNNAWAAAAIDRFESNAIATGIQPGWKHADPDIRAQIQEAWRRWSQDCDFCGQLDFYGLQALIARELFEAGEVFVRFRLRPRSDRAYIPLQLQLLESEQLPIWRQVPQLSNGGAIRSGIEFDSAGRRVAYHFYREHPGESMYYPDAQAFTRIPAQEIRHVYKFTRAGQLRGEPKMVSVLALLYELEQYTDAALVRKKIASMFAGFITKPSPEIDLFPPDPHNTVASDVGAPIGLPESMSYPDPGTVTNKLEAGTMQDLNPGESIVFPQLPVEGDFKEFMRSQLHKFAAGVGMTYEQCTGDLEGVNYSSIRAGMLEFRRACEQYQYFVLVQQACQPIMKRWLDEAVLAGRLNLPGYFQDPYPYQQVQWNTPGWEWIDPVKESTAAQMDVRSGFISRAGVIRSRGLDPEVVDQETAEERQRSAEMGIVFDSNPNQVLLKGGSQDTDVITPKDPESDDLPAKPMPPPTGAFKNGHAIQ